MLKRFSQLVATTLMTTTPRRQNKCTVCTFGGQLALIVSNKLMLESIKIRALKDGCICSLLGRGWVSNSNTMSLWSRPTFLPSCILIHRAIWPQQIWAKNLGAVPLWGRATWVPIQHNVTRAEAYLHANFHLDPSNHLATMHQRHRQLRQTTVR